MKEFEVLVTGRMMPLVMEQLESRFTLHKLQEAADRDAFLAEVGPRIKAVATGGHVRTDGALLSKLPNVGIVANFGVGYDSVDAGWAGQHGVVVTNTPDVLTEEVADTCLGLLLMTVRELSASERYLRSGRWEKDGPYPLTHNTLRGKTVGILALGRIGKAIATRCEAFGLTVVYHGRSEQKGVPYRYYPTLVGMAEASDILISVAPGGQDTFHIIDAEVLRALGPKGVLINIGRGTVVDEGALINALQNKVIAAAGLDVFEKEPHVPPELIAMEHVVLLPHVGSASHHTRNLMGQLVVDNIVSFLSGKGPITPVAETPWPPKR
ncbi:2-hydroxyacid dehydrogenase [Alsobacter sp. SYSU BS001988]